MKNEKEIILERENDPLAEAAKLDDPLSPRGADRHIDGAEEEWAREPHLFERLVRDAGTKMLDVKRDVRIFGQERASYLGRSGADLVYSVSLVSPLSTYTPRGIEGNLIRMKQPVVCCSPEVIGGTAVFYGTRVPVQTLLDYIEAGDTIDDFLEGPVGDTGTSDRFP
jgi:hypothetical protein